MRKKWNWYFCKTDRVAAWVLLGTMVVYFISGYGMTKGIIDTKLAIAIHNNILPLIALVAFTVHTFYAIRLTFLRWKIWNSFGKYLLIFIYLVLILGFLYVDLWYKKPVLNVDSKTQSQEQSKATESGTAAPSSSAAPTVTTDNKLLTTAVVAQHNTPGDCWIVLSEVVYDVTSYMHSGPQDHILCGKDNTSALTSIHGTRYSSYFDSYKIGTMGSTY